MRDEPEPDKDQKTRELLKVEPNKEDLIVCDTENQVQRKSEYEVRLSTTT